jgi:ADP-heptose:LPS heptosyltransferase
MQPESRGPGSDGPQPWRPLPRREVSMTLQSRILEVAKSLDAWAGVPLARHLGGRRREQAVQPRDVLFVRLWGLGNLTLLAPTLTAHRHRRLRLLTLEANAPFVRHHFPWVELLTLPAPADVRLATSAWGVARRLRTSPPDVVVDLEPFLRLHLLLVRGACQAPVVGIDTPGQGRRPLLDVPVAADPVRHVADTFATLIRAAGLDAPDGPGPLRVTGADRRRFERRFPPPPGDGPLVVLHPGTGAHAAGRRWPVSRFARLAAALADHGARLMVTGSPSEQATCAAVAGDTTSALDLSGRLDVGAWAACLQRADLLVTGDTGPLHVADALGTRTVSLFGPNSPIRTGSRLPGSLALYADLPCSPCLDARTMKRTACAHFACMDALDGDAVLSACLRVLSHDRAVAR